MQINQATQQICLTGASGFIGKRLLAQLTALGHTVRILTRKNNLVTSKNVEMVQGDLVDPDFDARHFIHNCDILFHCAGEIGNQDMMRALHVEGTQKLIDAAISEKKASGKTIHWVQLSSSGAYGPPARAELERTITEQTATNPDNEYEQTKTLSDELVITAGLAGHLSYTILRPSNVIGIGMRDQSLPKIINMVKRGRFFFLGKPGTITTYVHVNDVVKAMLLLAKDARAKGNIYNLSSDCTLEALTGYIAKTFEVKAPTLRIPSILVRPPLIILARLLRKWIHIPRLDALVLRTKYPSIHIQKNLGFEFSSPMPFAIDELLLNDDI